MDKKKAEEGERREGDAKEGLGSVNSESAPSYSCPHSDNCTTWRSKSVAHFREAEKYALLSDRQPVFINITYCFQTNYSASQSPSTTLYDLC